MTEQHNHGHGHGGSDGHGTMDIHGMLLFGEENLYLSHLPMFEHPHNFQVIVKVGFDDAATEVFRADRETTSHDCYTFVPEPFHITELDPSGDGSARNSIKGSIYRGHFERPGHAKIAPGAVAEIRRVVYFRKLDLDASHAAREDLTYLCFGRVEQLHLVHQITARPDFDQVLTARLIPGTVTNAAGGPVPEDVTEELEQAVPVKIEGRSDTPEDRLAPRESVEGFFYQSRGPTQSRGFRVQLEIDRQHYVELRELGSG